ncbi:hypothetical protein M2480_002037 [Parabacteroides sp. PFB2-12]|uniref:hypothetical protein n=1 Tax=unclassified Parabacteroides TaxID=2649774 RepID=UPI002475FDB9|nr:MULTISPECIES: hypothetical protein [unclassified Parabacteroides]MDH6342937.1 hypothetical protein [Parabacteroides sp. PM6-13]MDH6391048.1 hypothetical protein [Parabacteroides sp. PFB2-12]
MKYLEYVFDEINVLIDDAFHYDRYKNQKGFYGFLYRTIVKLLDKQIQHYVFFMKNPDVLWKLLNMDEHLKYLDSDEAKHRMPDVSKKKPSAFRKKIEDAKSRFYYIEGKIVEGLNYKVGLALEKNLTEKLLKIESHHNRILYAKLFAKQLDALLYCSYLSLETLEKNGYHVTFLTNDIEQILYDISSIYAHFDIDIVDILKENSDYEENFGSYDKYRVLPKSKKEPRDISKHITELQFICDDNKETIKQFLEHGYTLDKLKIKKGVTADIIAKTVMPLIDSGVFPQVNKDSNNVKKIKLLEDSFPKTFKNTITKYYEESK